MQPRPILCGDEPLYPCFKAIFQGDHLRVEFALIGHASLLEAYGLLTEECRVMGNSPFLLTDTVEGLVIELLMIIFLCQLQSLAQMLEIVNLH